MSKGINKVILIGNLGADPETKTTSGGNTVANFTVATSESWKDRESGEKRESTEWHRIVIWGKLAEICGEYLRKGSKVYLEGRLQTRKWQDRDGNDRWTTEVVAKQMQMLDGRPGQSSAQDQRSAQSQPPEQSQPDLDDDIPF